MGGSRRVARLAFYWALMGCGLAQAAVAQEAAKPASRAAVTAPSAQSQSTFFQQHSQAPSVRSSAPWLSQPWHSVQSDAVNKFNLGDQHTIVISTLGLILVGVVVLLLVT